MRTLILNQTNIVPDGENNKLVYRFPNSVQFKDSYIAVSSVFMYYSWFNIRELYQNNVFTYNWIDGAGVATTYTVTIPDGLYEISEINSYLQYVFIQNGHFLVNPAGDNVYYAEFTVNPERYAVQINTFLFPTALPALWTNPTGVAFPPQSFNPIVTLPAKFNEICGYVPNFATDQNLNNAYVPPVSPFVSKIANGTLSYISTTAPQVQKNGSILFSLSNIDNFYSQPSSLIYTLTPAVRAGEAISEKPPEYAWCNLINGTTSQLTLTILGTDLSPIQIRDPNMVIVLVIKDAFEPGSKI